MASTKGEEASGPSILCDETGVSIIPSLVPPQTTFPKTPQKQETSSASTDLPEKDAASSPVDQQSEGYFGESHTHEGTTESAGVEAIDHASMSATPSAPDLNKSSTNAVPSQTDRPKMRQGSRTERPRPAPRRSNLSSVLKRRTTANPFETKGRRVPYSFDTDSDDSDVGTSSSSDEDSDGDHDTNDASTSDSKNETNSGTGSKKRRHYHRRNKDDKDEKHYSKFNVGNGHYRTKGRVSRRDGRLNISVKETSNTGYLANAMGHTLARHLEPPNRHGHDKKTPQDHDDARNSVANTQLPDSVDAESILSSTHETVNRPRLNIVVMVIGSRGDIQPFMQVGRELKKYGHRVRIATHPAFRDFVENDVGLEFFSIGGDPSELMAFMVKNPGLIPSMETVRQGEIARRRSQMAEMFEGFWRACTMSSDDEKQKQKQNLKTPGGRAPFIADAIIANPPSFAHVHIAERLGIPLHMMFTFPYTPTQAFPHPLANIRPNKSNVDENYMNFMSYPLVEMMVWQGLGDLVNRFRVKTLGLEPVSSLWAPNSLYRMQVPTTYMWSPGLVPKPKDWGPEIDIGGYVFLDLASNYKPPQDLQDFLDAGEPPIYIGFGSIVVDDPDKFTQLIFDAVEMAGVRALVSKGWGGLGGDKTPDNIFMLENTPHDWLFPRCKAVVHHGGAGTCAIGLKCAKPTMIVPFFGDQPFWSQMVSSHKAGAHESIPYKSLTTEKFAEGIKQCLTDEAQENVQKLADSINKEGDGAENAVKSFHRSLPLAGHHNMRCSILEDRVAVWQLKRSRLRLSALAANILVESKKIRWNELRLLRVCEWNDFDGPGEPISGIGGVLMDTSMGVAKGVGMVPIRIAKHIKKHEKHEQKKKQRLQKKEEKARTKEEKARIKEANSKQAGNSKTDAKQGESRPAGPTHNDTGRSIESVMSADPKEPLAQELATVAGRGLLASAGAIVSFPVDLSVALAQGFHNAPRLYGDASVRKPLRITGMHSGAKAAGNEFTFGIYDGFTGLVTQPVHGWQDASTSMGRMSGLGKGVARGIGGFVLKDITAIIAPPAMLAQGVRKELIKRVGGPGTTTFVRKARIAQGQKDAEALNQADRKEGTRYLQDAQNMTEAGWSTMKEIWHEKEDYQQSHGGRLRGRLSMHKEERRWVENGALENVRETDRALRTKKQGKDLEKLFAQRKEEMETASQPRMSAMEQPLAAEEWTGIAANGHIRHSPQHCETKRKADEARDASKADGTGPAVDSSGMTDIRNEEEKKEDDDRERHQDEDDGEDSSDTAVESQDERTRKSHLKGHAASKTSNFQSSPAGRLNDIDIGKPEMGGLVGGTAVAA